MAFKAMRLDDTEKEMNIYRKEIVGDLRDGQGNRQTRGYTDPLCPAREAQLKTEACTRRGVSLLRFAPQN